MGPILRPLTSFQAGVTVRVDVYAETLGGRSGPYSDTVVIRNSPPAIERLEVIPAEPTLGDRLTLSARLRDPDLGDVARLVDCAWQRWNDGWENISQSEALDACNERAECEVGELVRVTCRATDDTDVGPIVASDPVTILSSRLCG